jgi:MHS family citrate/tricarballylate:H+ symporter-like MFS transporter
MAAAAGATAEGASAEGASAQDTPAHPPISTRNVAAAVVGNWLEFYDFIVYTFFTLQIGDAFFPSHSAFGRLMLSLFTFGVGFIFRPIGAVVIGRFSDRVGRRPAMLLSFGLMGAALLGFVCVPTYRQIGMWAPILAVTCRLVQGFALGGEVGPTTAYLIEAAPLNQRGLYGAWQSASQSLASVSAGLAGLTISAVLSASATHDWGWRIALAIGVLVLPVGMIIRRHLPETLGRAEPKLAAHADIAADAGPLAVLAGHWRVILLGLGLIAAATISTYVFSFMTTYAQTTLHMGMRTGLLVAVTNGIAGFAASIAGGALSDRFGRRALMIWPRILFLLAILPTFMLVVRIHQPVALLGMMAGLSIIGNLSGVPVLIAITESLRKDVRGVGVATIYATAVAVFGGTTQPIVAWLDHVTGNPLAIAWYLVGATCVGLLSSILIAETVVREKRA